MFVFPINAVALGYPGSRCVYVPCSRRHHPNFSALLPSYPACLPACLPACHSAAACDDDDCDINLPNLQIVYVAAAAVEEDDEEEEAGWETNE
jgi:hypothetical protein